MIHRYIGLLLCLLVFTSVTHAQFVVKGTIKDDYKLNAVFGAEIKQKGTSNIVYTNEQGEFVITVSHEMDSLQVSFGGFASQTVAVDGRKYIEVYLKYGDVVMVPRYIGIAYYSGVRYTPIGVAAEYIDPYLLNGFHLYAGYKVNGSSTNDQTVAGVTLDNVIETNKLKIGLSGDFNRINVSVGALTHYLSYRAWIRLQPTQSRWWMGVGGALNNIVYGNTTHNPKAIGATIGYKYLLLSSHNEHSLNVQILPSITILYHADFFETEANMNVVLNNWKLGVGWEKINSYNEINLVAGYYFTRQVNKWKEE